MTLRLDRTIAALALIAVCSPASNPVLAQQPTQQQIDAIRSNCRSDFLSNCSGVPRGGPEAVRCLKDHLAKLSPGCNAAVSAITPATAPKVAAPTPAPAAPAAAAAAPAAPPAPAPAAAATPAAPPAPAAPATPPPAQPSTASAPAAPPPATTKKVPPAPPKAAQPAAPQPNRAAAATAPAAPPAPAPAAQPSLLPLPPLAPRVRLMIVRTCSAEHRALCANVPPGGGGNDECLAEHGEALSPRCRDAILSAK
jgi:outer membrane biosynthesis protein TonB